MRFLNFIEPKDMDNLADYMCYRVQLSMYNFMEISKDSSPILWDEYVNIIVVQEKLQDILRTILCKALQRCSIDSFEFEQTEENMHYFDDSEKIYKCYPIIKRKKGRWIILKLMLKSQIAYYLYLRKQLIWKEKIFYTWHKFCKEISVEIYSH